MFLCAMSEKVLRIVYKSLAGSTKYIPVDGITLGQLLNKNNRELSELFGEKHINHLAFFLSQVGEKKIGFNYRNSLAHWNSISGKDVNYGLVLRILYIFTDILNTIFYYCWENET